MSPPTTVTASLNPPSATEAVPCPRCRHPLIDPKGLGWCKACGYCQSLEETTKKDLPAPKPMPVQQMPGAPEGGFHVPKWIFVMLLGIALIGAATYGGSRLLTLTPLERALLTSLQIGAGIMIMFAGQFVGLLRIAPEDSTLSFKDAVFPFRLYGMIFKRLPRTAITVYGGSWGLATILSAVVFFGGLGHWLTYVKDNKKNNNIPQSQKARL